MKVCQDIKVYSGSPTFLLQTRIKPSKNLPKDMFYWCNISLSKRHICANAAHEFLLADLVHDSSDFALVTVGEILQEFSAVKLFFGFRKVESSVS